MPDLPFDPESLATARQVLDELLPHARRKAAEPADPLVLRAGSAVGRSALPHYRIANCVGVAIYQGEKGGWFADLWFEDVPAGIPPIIGTPLAEPHSAPQEALAYAIDTLALLITHEDRPKPDPEAVMAAFPFDGVVIPIPSQMVADLREMAGDRTPPTPEYVRERIEAFRAEVLDGEPLTAERANAFPQETAARLMSIAAMALLVGIVRVPESVEADPPSPGRLH